MYIGRDCNQATTLGQQSMVMWISTCSGTVVLPQASSVDGVCHTSALYSWKMAWLTFGTNSDLMLWGDSKRECNVVITGATGQKKEHDRQLETRFQGSSLYGNKLIQNKLDLKYLFICVGKIRSKFTTGSCKPILTSWQCVDSLMLEALGTSPAPCGGKTFKCVDLITSEYCTAQTGIF